MLDEYEKSLLNTWEETFKKGQLSLWILLSLVDGTPKHAQEVQSFVKKTTNRTVNADDQSIYRALRKFKAADILETKTSPSEKGPNLVRYRLTTSGRRVLSTFIQDNIMNVYLTKENRTLFEKGAINER